MATTQFDPKTAIDAATRVIAEIEQAREERRERLIADRMRWPRWFGLVAPRTREQAVASLKGGGDVVSDWHLCDVWALGQQVRAEGVLRVAQAALHSGRSVTLDADDIRALGLDAKEHTK